VAGLVFGDELDETVEAFALVAGKEIWVKVFSGTGLLFGERVAAVAVITGLTLVLGERVATNWEL
jgi:hypothetical protein